MDEEINERFIPIGKMAKINHVSIATLRHYDKLGLLKPKYLNEQFHQQMAELKMRHDAVERAIRSIERYRKAPSTGTPLPFSTTTCRQGRYVRLVNHRTAGYRVPCCKAEHG